MPFFGGALLRKVEYDKIESLWIECFFGPYLSHFGFAFARLLFMKYAGLIHDQSMNIHFNGIWRMDWGLGNPNKTAALIAVLMIIVWALPLIRRWLFWVALPIFTALGVCLMHTMSRGGLVAAFSSLGLLLFRLPRPWPRIHVRAVVIAVTIMLAGAMMLQTTARFAQSYKDRSISNRLEVWGRAPQMIVDAPHGWGLGNSGKAFGGWYQSLGSSEDYRTLVNSHLTWLVEFGWPMRAVYVLGWMAVFVLCFPPQGRFGFSIAFGAWLAFFVASTFSSVAEVPWLWVGPVLALAAVILARFRLHLWPSRRAWACGCAPGLAILIGLAALGFHQTDGNIHVSNDGSICVGGSKPQIWVLVGPSAASTTISSTYPRALREFLKSTPNVPVIGIANSPASLPNMAGCRLVVFGPRPADEWKELANRFGVCGQVVLLAPDITQAELKLSFAALTKTTAVFGEFTQRSSAFAWRDAGKFQQVEGVGDFFQNWPEVVFNALK